MLGRAKNTKRDDVLRKERQELKRKRKKKKEVVDFSPRKLVHFI